MRKYLAVAILLLCCFTALFSCHDKCDFCDSSKYKKIYSSGGYVVFQSLEKQPDSLVSSEELKSFKIPLTNIDTASRMVRYYTNDTTLRQRMHFPVSIDFSYYDVLSTLNEAIRMGHGDSSKAKLRLYFAAYDSTAIKNLCNQAGVPVDYSTYNFVTGILVGTYDGAEGSTYFNLGNLCPPNCPNHTPVTGVKRLYDKSTGRSDIP